VRGFGATARSTVDRSGVPRPDGDHSHRTAPAVRRPVPVAIGRRPDRACDEHPLAGAVPAATH
jgi:[mycofactocin precursor peptide]-tyrosine decarboxylase / 3-amino-5-[(4-hydroxyphenyl)methyl]-4,4-dimethylpyrrolidin-2-one synthase